LDPVIVGEITMAIIDLIFDEKRNLFSIPVILVKKPVRGIGNIPDKSSKLEWCNALMYVDTGSNLTSITEIEVDKLNLNRGAFKNQRVGGIGGFMETPTTNEVTITIMSGDSMIDINLDKIAAHPSQLKRKIQKKQGVYVQKGEEKLEMICLFGLDALEKLGGKLELDVRNKSGKIII
jgi:hypothetical protein